MVLVIFFDRCGPCDVLFGRCGPCDVLFGRCGPCLAVIMMLYLIDADHGQKRLRATQSICLKQKYMDHKSYSSAATPPQKADRGAILIGGCIDRLLYGKH
jgi:hypothetical protein